jgi:hypothetical protein
MGMIGFYTLCKIGQDDIWFPEDDICCKNCIRAYTDSMNRPKCPVLNRIIFDKTARYDDCPIVVTGEIRGRRKEKA